MNEQLHIDAEALVDEASRYLAIVDAFRELECEPTWWPEPTWLNLHGVADRRGKRVERSAH